MKQRIQELTIVSSLLLAALFLLPAAVVPPFEREEKQQYQEQKPAEKPKAENLLEGSMSDQQRTLQVLVDGQTVEMKLADYLAGVVAAEMPAAFHLEALKAQTVAARTYTLYQIQNGGRHGETADICTESTCCQAYVRKEDARAGWGEHADDYEEKIMTAVMGTDGQVILYGGNPILAVFHAASAGQTRPAGKVWSGDLPYLQAVLSPENAESVPDYYSRVMFSPEDFRRRVLEVCPAAALSDAPETWLDNAVTDAAGNVETVNVGGVKVKGSTLRGALGLRSACFTWEVQEGNLVFFVTGYGHGVGLSQYGANAMAEKGADYREILEHYYTGIVLDAWNE